VTPGGRDGGRQPRREQSRYDQDLGNAKNAGTKVRFYLAIEVDDVTNEVGAVVGYVEQIDKYDIQVRLWDEPDRKIWIKKNAILGTEVLRASTGEQNE
jgi:hypothetical protein